MRMKRLGITLLAIGLAAALVFAAVLDRLMRKVGGGSLEAGCAIEGPGAPGMDTMNGAEVIGFVNLFPLGRACTWTDGDVMVTAYPGWEATIVALILLAMILAGAALTVFASRNQARR